MTERFRYKITIESDLTLDGLTWRVKAKNRDGYLVLGPEGEQVLLTFERIKSAIENSACEIVSPKEREDTERLKAFTGGYTHVDQLTAPQQRNALALAALINAVDELEADGQKVTHRYLDQLLVRKDLYARAVRLTSNPRLFDEVSFGPTRPSIHEPESIVPKGRSMSDKRKLYNSFGRNPVVLGHRHHSKGSHGVQACKLSEWQIQFVKYCLNANLNTTNPQLMEIYKTCKGLMPVPEEEFLRGRSHPSLQTVWNWKKEVSFIAKELARYGARLGKNKYGSGSTDCRALMFGERAAMDQAYLSIFVNADGAVESREIDPETVPSKLEENEILRVWLHLMIDVATRQPLAWILSETAHSDNSMALFRMATRDKTKEKVEYGCKMNPAPAAGLLLTVADNGTATRNGSVYSAQLGVGTSVQTGRTYHSNDNAHVERIFGTIQFQVLNFEGGYVGSKPGDNPGYDPKANTHLTPYDLYGVLTRYLVDEYSHSPHRGVGMFGATPHEKLEEITTTYGKVDAPSPRARRMHFGFKRTVSTTSEGILFNNLPFTSPALNTFHDGMPKKVDVYLDPDFIHTVTILPHDGSAPFDAELSLTAYRDLSYEKALEIMKVAAQGNPKARDLTNQMVLKAKVDRAKRSGFYKDPVLPESYQTLHRLEDQSKALAQIGHVANHAVVASVKPGSITMRPKKLGAKSMPHVSPPEARAKLKTGENFAPITESKL
jgi:hypothetical protein